MAAIIYARAMNRHDIITLPAPSLREKSRRVGIVDDSIKKLIKDMADATLDWEAHREHEFGVALAAVQINELLRVVVVREDFEDKDNKNFSVFINPEIAKTEGEPIEELEGCLSVRDLYGKVPRYPKVKIKALNAKGKPIRVTAEGFLARVFQHEIDHTKGLTYVDRIGKSGTYYVMAKNGELKKLEEDEKLTILKDFAIPN